MTRRTASPSPIIARCARHKTFRSVLDEIPGIGPKRKKTLLRHFGSARAIASASVEEIAAVEGMTRDVAERVKEHIGNGQATQIEPS